MGFLAKELGPDACGRLLDAGCGPGVLTVRLAALFTEAVGLDPDADMLAEGRRAAEELGVMNVRWVQARAEDLPDAASGPYRLVTFGQSFHWSDEQRIAETVYDLLEPGGALALVAHTVEGRPQPPIGGTPIPHAETTALVEKYLGCTRRAGQGAAPARTHRFEDVLAGPASAHRALCFFQAYPTRSGTARACCPATSPCRGRHRTCSVTVPRGSLTKCERCWRPGHRAGSSGTGLATPRSCWPASRRARRDTGCASGGRTR